MARTVAGLEQLGQAITDSDLPLAELEVPLKMCAAPCLNWLFAPLLYSFTLLF